MTELIKRAKLRLLQMHYEAGVGHIGGNLSCLDALMVLFHQVMKPEDQFILSKGHAAGALYVTLWSLWLLTDDDLKTFHQDGTLLAGHPIPRAGLPQIPFATGSLGHGLPVAAGMALAKKLKGEPGRVFVLMSDGEWQEGSNWEALMFAYRMNLSNLTMIVDVNGVQGLCPTFQQGVVESAIEVFTYPRLIGDIAGNGPADIADALSSSSVVGPIAVFSYSKKGAGVSFMENKVEWHYLPMTAEQYAQARAEVERA